MTCSLRRAACCATCSATGAYVEGWAEYGADVMTQEGYLDFNPKFKLVRLKIWLRRGGNTILDIRLQTMNMTDQQALDLMTKECFQTQAEAEGKLVRAKLSSTQLPTYFVGTRQWWDAAQEVSGGQGQQLHAGRVPRSRPRSGAAADRVSGEDHSAGWKSSNWQLAISIWPLVTSH